MTRAGVSLAIALVFAFASRAAAQEPAAIELEIGAREARAIDVPALREAIARELGIEVGVASGARGAVPRVRVRQIARGRAVLELVRPDGSRMRRSAELHDDAEERLETIVILAVNMVRDEASELLELLRRRRARAAEGASGAPTDAAGGAATDGATGGDAAGTSGDTAAGDAASTDAASTDAASTDAASTDAASTDAASTDAASTDAASTDTAAGDATASDPAATIPEADSAATPPVAAEGESASPTTATSSVATPAEAATAVGVEAAEPSPPGHRFLRIGLGGLAGSVPRGSGYEGTVVYGLELAWTPTDFLAFGLRDMSGGAPLGTSGRWSAGGALFGEVGWILDPALVLHLEIGADVRANGSQRDATTGVAPMLLLGARWFPMRELSLALQTALHVVATDAWSTNLHVMPQGAVLWTVGLTIAGHVS